MKNYYLLFASGKDRPGIVAAVSEALFKSGCNLEDSSMMRLGGEFGIFLIFTSGLSTFHKTGLKIFGNLRKQFNLTLSFKRISKSEALFRTPKMNLFLVKVMGEDKPGIVFKVCQFLFKHRFNISDLETHRTQMGKRPGYILFIEGEFRSHREYLEAKKNIGKAQVTMGVKVQIDPIPVESI